MDKDKLPKIECTTVVTRRNTMTGETFKDKKEGDNIVQDVTVQVTNKGLQVFQKVMNQKNNDKKT